MALSPFGLIGALVSTAACGLAFKLGERPERLAAGGLVAGLVLVPVVQDRVEWLDPQFRFAVIDLLLFILLGWLTSTTRRRWLLFATAFQLLSVLVDAMHALDARVGGRAFLSVAFALGYAVEAALLWGALQVAAGRRSRVDADLADRAARFISYFGRTDAAMDAAERAIETVTGRARREAVAVRALVALAVQDEEGPKSPS